MGRRGWGACAVDEPVPRSSGRHAANGDIYVGDAIGRIRKIDAESSETTTVAGTGIQGYSGDGRPATNARIGSPTAIALDGDGNVYFSDSAYHVVRKVDRAGTITTVAGNGEPGFSPDGAIATEARLNQPRGSRSAATAPCTSPIRATTASAKSAGTAASQQWPGSADGGDSGDGSPADNARLNEPHGLCLYGDDVLLISDHFNNRIRAVRLR